jgi:8-oxo-dGTP pyrophosphatase MutT (NUDIX family)
MDYLRHLIASNNFDPEAFVPFVLDGKQVGWISQEFRRRLLDEPVFVEHSHSISLRPEISGFEHRTEVLMEIVHKLHAEELIPLVMNEPYPVSDCCRDDPLCLIDRPAAARFGIRSYGQHVNGIVRTPDGIMMWIGKRAQDRGICPGQLDQMVAGGLPYGISLDENLRKECYEEAGISEELANRAIPAGLVRYRKMTERGGKEDVLYVYDLELPADFTPRNTDGEVEEFRLLPIEEVARLVRETDEFKLNCNLVIIDFLIRHGLLPPDHEDYLSLVSGLRCPEYFASNS